MSLSLSQSPRKHSGFTLVELMVVMAIIAILATAGLSAFMSYIDKARVTKIGEFARGVDTSLADKPVLRLDFDNNFLDTSGYNHHGTCTGSACPTPAVGHNGGGAYLFDGVDDTLTLGIGSDFFPMPTFTLCAWVKTPGLGTGMTWSGILSVTSLTLYLDGSGKLVSRISVDGVLKLAYGTSNLYDNRFHHVCVAHDGNQRHLYVDGVNEKSDTVTWSGTTTSANSSVLIGAEINNPPARRFNGIIDDVRFYSGSLLAGDIEKMYRESAFKYLAQR